MTSQQTGGDRELWRGIPGFEDAYQISSRGRVRSLDRVRESTVQGKPRAWTRPGKVATPSRQITLWKNRQRYYFQRDNLLREVFEDLHR